LPQYFLRRIATFVAQRIDLKGQQRRAPERQGNFCLFVFFSRDLCQDLHHAPRPTGR
jgi:hypothetical protein